MGLLNKAKLAAKRAALKGVPKSIRDLSFEPPKPAAQKSISALRSQAPESQERDGDGDGDESMSIHLHIHSVSNA